ncbi:MAG: MBL fold metallo-hydrolase [Lachnospiraceae bacterium]|nr:MBL fold metallo-hydrolase [Robinsoniella sp.]MDY3765143.1 MBL fold metallo-hydrolase [Lachnospiraceae bacterium]
MRDKINFIALGGGQRVGASCYYLRLGQSNLLLDCGVGSVGHFPFEPDFYPLLQSPFIQSLSQIDQIFISHAHADHVGGLPSMLARVGKEIPVCMTQMTAMLSQYQLYDKNFVGSLKADESARLAVKNMLEHIVPVSYFQTMNFGTYKATFFPAGHIPGAMMTLLEYRGRNILYTGDYSITDTPLTTGCILPEDLNVDTVILCGLHAKHPNFHKKTYAMYQTIQKIFQLLDEGKSVYCCTHQLSKGVEFLKILNEKCQEFHREDPIFLEETVMNIVGKLEGLSIPIVTAHNYSIQNRRTGKPHIVLGGRSRSEIPRNYERIDADFSLHEDFAEMAQFLKKMNPKWAVIVHCGSEKEGESDEDTIEQYLMRDADCRTQFLFAEEGEIYTL